MSSADGKITPSRLARDAYLYVRQSTLRQVTEHGESTQRQYALRNRAIALGWPAERIHVIDCDLGKSGADAARRDGFQQLVSEVALSKVGIILGLEVSRLARNNADWHRLLELCSLTDTLILDEDGVYDPTSFNDRLLLGLKGTMSEAELHVLKARMRGGQLSKAQRGELEMAPPVGLVTRNDGKIVIDPDASVQSVIRLVFDAFERTGSAFLTVRFLREENILFPRRLRCGPDKGDLLWAPAQHSRILQVLHNPRYAGAFVYGRTRSQKSLDGGTSVRKVPRKEWRFVIPNMHEGYIDWDRFEANQRKLAENARLFGSDRRGGPAREGPALLQGRVLCGLCGERMSVQYHVERGDLVPDYVCKENLVRRAGRVCQSVPGKVVDEAVGGLLLELVTPMSLAVTLEVQREIEARAAEIDAIRRQTVERVRFEAESARRRYMKVDPDNRLVADALEAEWNETLRRLTQTVEDYERLTQQQAAHVDEETRRRVLELADQLPKIWNDPRVQPRERKRILRLVVDDVTLIKGERITAHVRLSGGGVRTLELDRPLPIAQIRKFKPDLVAKVDRLVDDHCDREVAEILNREGCRTWEGKPFNLKKVTFIRGAYGLTSRHERLRRRGLLTTREVADKFGVSETAVHRWGRQQLLQKCYTDSLNRGLWLIPEDQTILKGHGGRGPKQARLAPAISSRSEQGAV